MADVMKAYGSAALGSVVVMWLEHFVKQFVGEERHQLGFLS